VLNHCSEEWIESRLQHHGVSCFSYASANSNLRSSQKPLSVRRKSLRVHFDDYIELAIGLEDEQVLYHLYAAHDVLQNWTEKPWNYHPKPPSRRFSWRKLLNLQYPFCDFSRCCEDNAEEAIWNEKQMNLMRQISNPNNFVVEPSSACSMPTWIPDVLALISSKLLDVDDSRLDHEVPVLSWLIDHGFSPVCYCSVPTPTDGMKKYLQCGKMTLEVTV